MLEKDFAAIFLTTDNSNHLVRTGAKHKMNKENFLTRRWNYIISLVQGMPTFAFIVYGLATPLGETQTGMIVLSVLGALF
jgi:hypothetical protein